MGMKQDTFDDAMFEAGAAARRDGTPKGKNPTPKGVNPLFDRMAEKWSEGWTWSNENEEHPVGQEAFPALYGLRIKGSGRLASIGVSTFEDPELRCPAKELSAYDSLYGQFILVTADRSMLETMMRGEQPYCGAIFDKVGLQGLEPEDVEIVTLAVVDRAAKDA